MVLEAHELKNLNATLQHIQQQDSKTELIEEHAFKQFFLNRVNKNNQGFFNSNPKKNLTLVSFSTFSQNVKEETLYTSERHAVVAKFKKPIVN
jgi:hypothetical protein